MYNIPVSVSDSAAINPTAQTGAGTTINFGAGASVRGDMQTLENTTDQRPTATSSASTGGPAASATDIADNSMRSAPAPNYLVPAIVVGVAIIAAVMLRKMF